MKLSTIYRRAAREVANAQARGRFMGCCHALELVSPVRAYTEARATFQRFLWASDAQAGYWWGA